MKRASYYGVLLIVVTLFISLYFNKEQPNDNGSSDELYLDTVYVFYSDEKEAWVINDNNWKQHPEIIEVKKVYNSIQIILKHGNYTTEEASKVINTPYPIEESPIVYIDETGKIFEISFSAGSEDSARQFYYYFDKDQRLRFLLIKAGAVNGSRLNYRAYFTKTGKKIWDDWEDIEGPGYPWGGFWRDELFINDPIDYLTPRRNGDGSGKKS